MKEKQYHNALYLVSLEKQKFIKEQRKSRFNHFEKYFYFEDR